MAWAETDHAEMTQLSEELNFDYIEAVYSKIPDAKNIYAVQGIFYNSGINSFNQVGQCCTRLKEVVKVCLEKDIKIITLGSPSMRVYDKRGMKEVFKYLEEILDETGITVCVEPNSKLYGAEYYWSMAEIVEDIVDYKNIKTMIDTGSLIMEEYDIEKNLIKYYDYIKHFHVSAPQLLPVNNWQEVLEWIEALRHMGYAGGVTYEIKESLDTALNMREFAKRMSL